MDKSKHIWLASYPRSGNTLLRTILRHCFGLRSASVYPNDLGGNRKLEDYVGHIERGADGKIRFPAHDPVLIKTHEYPADNNPAIYIVRDGRAAAVSLWEFYNRSVPLTTVIAGEHRFGTWSDHLAAWKPLTRPDTLLIRYESMVVDLPLVLSALETFLERSSVNSTIPGRDTLSSNDGRWVRKKSDWESSMEADAQELFWRINRRAMEEMSYPPRE